MFDRSNGRSLRTAFQLHADRTPDRPALVLKGRTLTYGDMHERAHRIAAAILANSNVRPERVGVFAYRAETTYTGILGSLYAGATYVPLNRRFPIERTRKMIRSADLVAIVVDQASAAQLPQVLQGIEPWPLIIAEDEQADLSLVPKQYRIDAGVVRSTSFTNTLPAIVPDDIAYLLFTSGTTGEPKGVMVSHGNVLHLLDVLLDDLEYTPDDRSSQHFDHTFDVSVYDLFATWEAGGCVCVPQPNELLAPGVFANQHKVTIWFSVPSLVAQMIRGNQLRPGSLPYLRLSMFAGEAMPRPTMEQWQAAAVNARVINMYGPTETTIVCSGYPWDSKTSPAECINDLVPIGTMFPGVGVTVVDESLKPVADGEPGELLIAGPLTCPGYWRDPERTAERFVWLPVNAHEWRRFYRSGDRVVRQTTGHYAFLGRVDFQIKVRGYRIELAEIESVLLRQNGVISAAAIGWPLEEGRPAGIVSFAVGANLNATALLAACREQLPGYMVPSEVVLLDEFPLNVNGKIDRAALERLMSQRVSVSAG